MGILTTDLTDTISRGCTCLKCTNQARRRINRIYRCYFFNNGFNGLNGFLLLGNFNNGFNGLIGLLLLLFLTTDLTDTISRGCTCLKCTNQEVHQPSKNGLTGFIAAIFFNNEFNGFTATTFLTTDLTDLTDYCCHFFNNGFNGLIGFTAATFLTTDLTD